MKKFMKLHELEREHIIKVLEATKNNKLQTSRILGIGKKTLYNKLHLYNLFNTYQIKLKPEVKSE